MSVNKKINGTLVPLSGGEETPIATTTVAGKVKPDGTTITITQDGTITSVQQENYWEQRTLSALNWNSNTKSYDLTSIYPSNEYDILELTPIYNVTTDAQLKAWKAAQCGGYNETNVLYARGEVPSIDIVLMALVHQK